jgi:hypothetical protein
MGFFDRLSRLIRANANAALSSVEDPGKILDQSVADMQSDLVKLRQAVATAIASQKRIANQAEQAESQSATWYERAELALKKGEEDLAKEALARRRTCQAASAKPTAALALKISSSCGNEKPRSSAESLNLRPSFHSEPFIGWASHSPLRWVGTATRSAQAPLGTIPAPRAPTAGPLPSAAACVTSPAPS